MPAKSDFEIVEREAIPKKFSLIVGLPDVGLVGVLGVSHMVKELGLKEVGYIHSNDLPPVVVLHDGLPKNPIRLFAGHSIVAVLAETTVPVTLIRAMANALTEWSQQNKSELVVCVGGMAVQNRQDIEAPKVFAALSDRSLETRIGRNAEVLIDGYIVGVYGVVLRRAYDMGIPAIALLTQSYYNYPDPEAAAVAVQTLNSILGTSVDVSDLLRKGDEIRLKAKDIMRRTNAEMARMDKSQEYDVPPLYM
jgi:uncharacterized protein